LLLLLTFPTPSRELHFPIFRGGRGVLMEKEINKKEKKKGFFAKLFETVDKKLADKAKKAGSCCGSKEGDGDSCCG
jgi:hypothetical protein